MPTAGDTSPTNHQPEIRFAGSLVGIMNARNIGIFNVGQHGGAGVEDASHALAGKDLEGRVVGERANLLAAAQNASGEGGSRVGDPLTVDVRGRSADVFAALKAFGVLRQVFQALEEFLDRGQVGEPGREGA